MFMNCSDFGGAYNTVIRKSCFVDVIYFMRIVNPQSKLRGI